MQLLFVSDTCFNLRVGSRLLSVPWFLETRREVVLCGVAQPSCSYQCSPGKPLKCCCSFLWLSTDSHLRVVWGCHRALSAWSHQLYMQVEPLLKTLQEGVSSGVPEVCQGSWGFFCFAKELQCSCYVKHWQSKCRMLLALRGTLDSSRLCLSFFIRSLCFAKSYLLAPWINTACNVKCNSISICHFNQGMLLFAREILFLSEDEIAFPSVQWEAAQSLVANEICFSYV